MKAPRGACVDAPSPAVGRPSPSPQLPQRPLKGPNCAMCPLGSPCAMRQSALGGGRPDGSTPPPLGCPLSTTTKGPRSVGWGAHSINFPRARAKAWPFQDPACQLRAHRAPVPVPLGVLCVPVGVGRVLSSSRLPPTACTNFHLIFTQRGGVSPPSTPHPQCHCAQQHLAPALGLPFVPRPPLPSPHTSSPPCAAGVGGAPQAPPLVHDTAWGSRLISLP